MPALWSYPWTLTEEGLDDAWETLDRIGVDAINLASHYHSVRSMQPRFPDNLFVQYPGGCYFKPDSTRFNEIPIDPLPNRVEPFDDPLAEIVESADAHGFDVNGWTVLFHNSRLGAANPDYRMESVFGDPQDHAFCPSHEAVQRYFTAVVAAVASRGVDEVQLESLGFPTVFHGHGSNFGHDKHHVITSQTEKRLLSQCFCDGCRAAAEEHTVDLDDARETVVQLVQTSFEKPHSDPPSLGTLVQEYPELRELFDFRAAVIQQLCERLAGAVGGTPLNYFVMEGDSLEPDVWPAGVHLTDQTQHLDRVTALCYVNDPSIARDRIERIQRLVDCPVDAGITLDPQIIRESKEFQRVVDSVRSITDGRLHVYHHSLMTDAQLEWVNDAIQN